MAFNDAKRELFLAKVESTAGVDASPTHTANAILLTNPTPIQYQTEFINEPFLTDVHTPQLQGVGRRLANVTVETKLMGRGDNGGVPFLDPLFRGAGMALTTAVETGNDVWTYTPRRSVAGDASAFETITCYSYEDGILEKAIGCKGTFVLNMEAGKIPSLTFNFTGAYVAPTTTATPSSPTFPTDTKTMVQSESLVIGSYSPSWTTFRLTHGNDLQEVRDGNSSRGYHSHNIAGRDGARLDIEVWAENTLANKNFFTYIETQGPVYDDISLTHTNPSDTQSEIVIAATDPQLISDPRPAVANGLRRYSLSYLLRGYTIKFREENT